jgi:leukotriene-A4 hydrolase
MVATKFYFQIISVFLLLLLTNSKDVSTQSNYDVIKMNHLSGEFKIDFEKKIVHGSLIYNLTAESAGEQIIFDTNKLNITKVYKIDTKEGTTEDLTYTSEDGEEYLGKKLIIELKFEQNDNVQIKIEYKTTHDGDSAQFLQPEQTFGKSHPYFFTVSEMILGRSLFPCQDTPAVKFKFDLTIIVPKDLKGMISGILVGEEEYSDTNYKAFNYK